MKEPGINYIIRLYNFINSRLIKSEVKVRLNNNRLEFTQDGLWVLLPDELSEVMVVPSNFKEGYIRKSDLIKLYDELKYICSINGRIPDYYTNSIVSPEKFGFTVWSNYIDQNLPGIKKIQTFRLKVRGRFGFQI